MLLTNRSSRLLICIIHPPNMFREIKQRRDKDLSGKVILRESLLRKYLLIKIMIKNLFIAKVDKN